MDIELRNGVESFQENSKDIKSIIKESFMPFLSNLIWDFLLIPFHKDNPEELEKLKKALEFKKKSVKEKLPPTLYKNMAATALI